MFTINLHLQIFCLMITIRTISSGFVPDLKDYSPTDEAGTKHNAKTTDKIIWEHFVTRSKSKPFDIGVSAAEFLTEDGKDCIRVVVFSGDMAAMEDVKVSCDSPEPLLGLYPTEERLWYYGTVFSRRISDKSYSETEQYTNKFIVVKANADSTTCEKTWWIIVEREDSYRVYNIPFAKSSNCVTVEEDEDCEEVISQRNFLTMLLYSPKGDVTSQQPSAGLRSFNSKDAVGATVREYRKGMECFQLLSFTSRGRTLTSMKMSCGPLQGVTMTEKNFYYGKTVMIKMHDDLKTFTVFYLPTLTIIGTICITNTFRLDKGSEGDIIKKVSTTMEYSLSEDCSNLKSGNFQGATWINKHDRLKTAQSTTRDRITQAYPDITKTLKDYTCLVKINDFNIGNEIGAIILPCYKGSDKRELVVIMTRGVSLTAVVVSQRDSPSLDIRGDVLLYNRDLMVRKSSTDTDMFAVLVSNDSGGCFKVSYTVKTVDGKVTKKEIPGSSVDKQTDSDCKTLLEAV